MTISKELLGLVLGEELDILQIDDNEILCFSYTYNDRTDYLGENNYLNVDTLTRLMKEWCLEQGYTISALPVKEEYIYWISEVIRYTDEAEYREFYDTENTTEHEAVLKATKWVAKEKGLIWKLHTYKGNTLTQ